MTKKILILTLSLLTINLVSKAQVELTSTSVGATYYVTVPGTFVLTPGLQVTFKANVDNSASMSLDVSGTGAKPIRKLGGSQPLSGSDILSNQIVTVAYDGTNWQMLSAVGSTPAASNDWTTTGNGGTNAATNYIGTSDPVDLSFRTNGVIKARLTQKGQLEILNTGSSTFIGQSAGTNDDLNNRQNVFIGAFAGTATSTGNWNTALGYDALGSNITGTSNTAIGRTTLSYSTGSNNTATGTYSLFWGTTGSGNTGTGAYAGQTIKSGSNNTFLGYNADATDSNLTNATAIGYNAKVGQSNSLVLGGTGADIVNVGIGTVTPNERLHVVGDINVTNAIKLNGSSGTAGQVLTSGGAGGADTWTTPAASVNIYNSNGALTAARTVTQGANTLAFTATSVNAFSVDGSTFSVDATNNNVGIGTTAPSQKLHVTGGQIYSNWASPNGPANVFINNWNSGSGPGYNTGTLGQVTIATSDAAESKYAIQGYAGGDGGSKYGITGSSMGLGNNTGGYFSATGGTNNYAIVVPNGGGHVGIGTTAPSLPLDVANSTQPTTSRFANTFSSAANKLAVYGWATGTGAGANLAGAFEATGSTSTNYGVQGNAYGNSGAKTGVYGTATGAGTNIAGYFSASGGTTNHAIQLVDGSQANNRVLASDAAGNATWTDLTALSSGSTAWTRSTPNIYPTTLTDNVGIGTASPSERLEVSGNIEVTGATDQFMINNTRALNMNGTENVFVGNNAASGSYSTIIGYQSGNVNTGISNTFVGRQSGLVNTTGGQNAFYGIQSGAGNTTGQYNTFIGRSAGLTNSTGNNNTILGGTADVASGALTYASAIGYGATIAQSYGMALGGTGANAIEVGIGVNNNMAGKLHAYSSTPTYNIAGTDYNSAIYGEVVGAVYSSRGIMGVSWATGTYGIGAYGSAQGAATNNYGVYGYASGGTNNYAGYFDAGNVFINNRLGINDPAPTYELDVSSLTTTYAGRFRNTGTGGADGLRVEVITAASAIGTRYGTYSLVQNGLGIQYGILGIAQTGGTTNYGVYGAASGGSTNNYAIYCAGSGGYTGTWSLISDQRFKENIKPLTGALDKILSLEPKTYNLKAEEYSYLNFPTGTQIGLISQEVEKIIPELVEKASHPGPIDEKTGEPTGNPIEFKSMNYIGLTPVLVQAIKEQQAIIEDLKKQLEAQKLRIDAIENK